mmetsp:Transcript_2409/g.6000  ORF Transcript_2409/g.6000 Transcript_2409/m.6000 type:complete len:239 (-) Transcript_2409:2275-2991(-)
MAAAVALRTADAAKAMASSGGGGGGGIFFCRRSSSSSIAPMGSGKNRLASRRTVSSVSTSSRLSDVARPIVPTEKGQGSPGVDGEGLLPGKAANDAGREDPGHLGSVPAATARRASRLSASMARAASYTTRRCRCVSCGERTRRRISSAPESTRSVLALTLASASASDHRCGTIDVASSGSARLVGSSSSPAAEAEAAEADSAAYADERRYAPTRRSSLAMFSWRPRGSPGLGSGSAP